MSAQRAMRAELTEMVTPATPTQRATRAARSLPDDVVPATRAMRPAMRAIAAPVTFSVVRTRYASPAKKKRFAHPVAAIFAPLGVAVVLAGAGLSGSGYSFAAEQPVNTSVNVATSVANTTSVGEDDVVADDTTVSSSDLTLLDLLGDSTNVEPLSPDAQDAMQTDAAVKAAAAAAAAQAQAEAEAAAAAQAAADQAAAAAKAASSKSSSGTGAYASFDTHDGNSTTQNYQPNVTAGQFIWPVSNYVMTSPFGYRSNPITGAHELHSGMDLAVPCGTPIHASAAGTVVTAGWGGSLGNYTEIDNGNGLETGYGHQMQIAVKVGQQVTQGQVIGYVGHTGAATGCHVHFLAAYNGNVFNPLNLVK